MSIIQKKKITLRDVANEAQTSVSTVSMALAGNPNVGEDTTRRIRKICKEMGYRSLTEKAITSHQRQKRMPKRFQFIALGTRLSDEVLADTLHELAIQARSKGIRLDLSTIVDTSSLEKVREHIFSHTDNIDGLFLLGLVDRSILLELNEKGIPNVVIGHTIFPSGQAPVFVGQIVSPDEISMGRFAASHFILKGHTRIGFVCERIIPGLSHHAWLSGYNMSLYDAGIDRDDSLIQITGQVFSGGGPAAKNYINMENPPTAYIIPDVRIAATFINTMKDMGQEVAVENIIIGGYPSTAIKYCLQSYQLLETQPSLLAKAAVERLIQISDEPSTYATKLQVPFSIHNFTTITENEN